MKPDGHPKSTIFIAALGCSAASLLAATNTTEHAFDDPASTPSKPPAEVLTNSAGEVAEQSWNFHVQNTVIVQGDPGFPAKYSGPNSLDSRGEVRDTVSLDLFAGLRLWRGAEAHVDGLMWQGFGLSITLGVDGFPNGEAFRLGTDIPNVNMARLFVRQTIGFGG